MMKSRVRIATILFASLLCLQQQRYHYCNAAAPTSFVKKRRSIVTFPHLKRQIDTSSLLSSALSEDQDALSLPLTSSAAGHDANTETSTVAISSKKRSNNILRGGGSSILFLSSSTILPTITTILTQSLNIVTAALVGSGYIGCYIASFIIAQLAHYCTTAATITTNNNNGGSSTLWKWKWTILATITHLLSSSSNNNHHKNLIFLPTLWGYSHQINPTLGGIIGCTHLLLGGLSSLLGSQTVVNTLSELMDVRLPPLDEHGSMSYNIDTFLQEQQSNKNQSVVAGKEMLVRIFSSLDIFTSFPRDCLSFYLGSCVLLTYWSSMTNEVMGEKTKLGMMSWWMNGLLLSGGGQSAIGEDTAATAAAAVMVDRKMITTRLFALHWVIMVVKGATPLLLQLL